MRGLFVAVVAMAALSFCAPAEAAYHWGVRHHVYTHHYGRYLAHRHRHHLNRRLAHRLKRIARPVGHHAAIVRGGSLPAPCRVAASMGGPCGCWAAHVLLDRLDHVWRGVNLWLADDWLKFPRAKPAPGTAAVWVHRHVAPVVAVNHDGTVTVRDSWAVHRVRMAGLVFVQPPVRRPGLVRYVGGVPL